MSGFGTARLLFCHQNEEPQIFFEVLSATTAFSLIFVSEYMLGYKVLICISGRPSEAGHDLSINLKTKKRLRYYSLLGKSAKFYCKGNNRQQCLRSAVYPYVSQHKAYISIERGLLFNSLCCGCLAIP